MTLGTREVADYEPACPAAAVIGEKLAGSGCRCRVTNTDVLSGTDPSSLAVFCLDAQGYRRCPVWEADREATWAREEALKKVQPARQREARQADIRERLGAEDGW